LASYEEYRRLESKLWPINDGDLLLENNIDDTTSSKWLVYIRIGGNKSHQVLY